MLQRQILSKDNLNYNKSKTARISSNFAEFLSSEFRKDAHKKVYMQLRIMTSEIQKHKNLGSNLTKINDHDVTTTLHSKTLFALLSMGARIILLREPYSLHQRRIKRMMHNEQNGYHF